MGVIDAIKGVFSRGASAELVLQTDKDTYSPGDTVSCDIMITPKADFSVRQTRIELEAIEKVSYRSGKSNSVSTKAMYTAKEPIPGAINFTIGQPVQNKIQIKIPENSQPTYHGSNASHKWFVRLVLDIPLAIDIKKEKEIMVR